MGKAMRARIGKLEEMMKREYGFERRMSLEERLGR
jgi:hypothetical protein